MNWYAIYTKPRKEDAVAQNLHGAGFKVFNPKLKLKKFVRGRWREIVEQLFPCYLFVQFEPARNSWTLRYTRGVKKIIGGSDNPWVVSDNVIEFIKAHEEDGVTVIKPPVAKPGDMVKITGGPFEGLTGLFEKYMDGNNRAVLLLTAIEYQARVVVENAFLSEAG